MQRGWRATSSERLSLVFHGDNALPPVGCKPPRVLPLTGFLDFLAETLPKHLLQFRASEQSSENGKVSSRNICREDRQR